MSRAKGWLIDDFGGPFTLGTSPVRHLCHDWRGKCSLGKVQLEYGGAGIWNVQCGIGSSAGTGVVMALVVIGVKVAVVLAVEVVMMEWRWSLWWW